MSKYSTSTTIYPMLPGISSTTANDTLINQYSNRIGGLIDGYVGRWYDTAAWSTVSTTPQIIRQISDALVSSWVMRSKYTKDGQNINEWVEELARQAMKDLEGIRDQELIVLESDGSEAGRSSVAVLVEATRETYTPVFDLDNDTKWAVDDNLLDDIADDRT